MTIEDYIVKDGVLFKLLNKNEGVNYTFFFDFKYYRAYQGDDSSKSGAYIFRPDENYQDSLKYSDLYNVSIIETTLVS